MCMYKWFQAPKTKNIIGKTGFCTIKNYRRQNLKMIKGPVIISRRNKSITENAFRWKQFAEFFLLLTFAGIFKMSKSKQKILQ